MSSTLSAGSQILFADNDENSPEVAEETNDEDFDRMSTFSSTPGSKRKGKSSTPLEKRFLSSMATQEKVMQALISPSTVEEQFGQ